MSVETVCNVLISNSSYLDLCQDEVNGHVLVFDLGMSTLTLTVLCVRSGLVRTIHSQCFPGLGGTQLDAAVVTLLLQEYQR